MEGLQLEQKTSATSSLELELTLTTHTQQSLLSLTRQPRANNEMNTFYRPPPFAKTSERFASWKRDILSKENGGLPPAKLTKHLTDGNMFGRLVHRLTFVVRRNVRRSEESLTQSVNDSVY